MSQKAITIYTPPNAEPHITAEDDAFVHRCLLGAESGMLGSLTCVKVDNNTLRLSGGGVSNRGYLLWIPDGETLELTVENGAAGHKRIDTVAAVFTKGGGNMADTHVLQVIKGTPATGTPSAPALTTSTLLSAGNVNQVALFSVTLDGIEITGITQVAERLPKGSSTSSNGASSGGTSSDGSSSESGGTSGNTTTATGSTSGTLTSKVSSTASSPTVHYSAAYTAARSGSNVSVNLSFAGWLNTSGSTLGSGIKLTVYARLNGGTWQSAVIKNTSDTWSGTTKHSAGIALSGSTTASTAKVEWYVTRSGSTYSGTAGTLASAGAPKTHTINLPVVN